MTTFKTLKSGSRIICDSTDAAFEQWAAENYDGCLETLKSIVEDAETLARQARDALAELQASLMRV